MQIFLAIKHWLTRRARKCLRSILNWTAIDRSTLISWTMSRRLVATFLRADDGDQNNVHVDDLSGTSFAVVLKDIRLIGPHAVPITRLGRIVAEPISISRGEKLSPGVLERTYRFLGPWALIQQFTFALFPALCRDAEVDLAAHMVPREPGSPGTHNPTASYGHWMLEHLVQLRALESIESKIGDSIPIVINSQPEPFQTDSLRLVTDSSRQVISMDRQGLRVKRLVVLSMHTAHSVGNETVSEEMHWVRERLASRSTNCEKDADSGSAGGPRRVALLRENMPSRRLANISEVRQALARHGFVELTTGVLPLAEERNFLANAESIIAVSGSAIAKLLLAPCLRNLIVITGPSTNEWTIWRDLAASLQVDYRECPAYAVQGGSHSIETGAWMVEHKALFEVLEQLD